ncbi:MAG: class I SAM-dependent methyltransferase [Acidobacteria bacterium]|nr:class I SAM-dependent methyltransferase [Acidobacteriota bacterium]
MSSYELLDSGNGRKLEKIGPVTVIRQAAQAFWPMSLPRWPAVDAEHIRSNKGGGHWQFRHKVSDRWTVSFGGMSFVVKLTSFGHIGIFPEQQENWSWIRAQSTPEKSILNLFGYTGGSTLAAAQVGASVTHVDASKGVVHWARDNQQANGLDQANIRWLVDDVSKFMAREQRRNSAYDGIILDPPTYGRGSKGETFRIEDDLIPLLEALRAVVKPSHFGLLSCHTPGFTPLVLSQIVARVFGKVTLEAGEMVVPYGSSVLPSGTFVRWLIQ